MSSDKAAASLMIYTEQTLARVSQLLVHHDPNIAVFPDKCRMV